LREKDISLRIEDSLQLAAGSLNKKCKGSNSIPRVSLLVAKEFNSTQTDTKISCGGAEAAEKEQPFQNQHPP
jgi:hypothetical protein